LKADRARRASVLQGTAILSRNRLVGRAAQTVRPNGEDVSREKFLRAGVILARGVRPGGTSQGILTSHIDREIGRSPFSPQGRVLVNRRVVTAPPLQRVSTMLDHLRALSPQERRDLPLEHYDRPKDLQVALAIRARALKIVKRIEELPLRDILKVQGIKVPSASGKNAEATAALPPREMLARREVRLLIRDLVVRLKNFMSQRSTLYKRVTTELTLAELHRLVAMLEGNRAGKGLGRRAEMVESSV
jgi:hypothetical protein